MLMRFGQNKGYGTPFLVNEEVQAWVLRTVNGQYVYKLKGAESSEKFNTQRECELALLKVFDG